MAIIKIRYIGVPSLFLKGVLDNIYVREFQYCRSWYIHFQLLHLNSGTQNFQEICGEELEYFVHFILDNSHSRQAFKSRAPRKCPLPCGCWGVISQDGSFYCTNVTSITFRWDKRKRERVFENQFSQTPYVRTFTGLELH